MIYKPVISKWPVLLLPYCWGKIVKDVLDCLVCNKVTEAGSRSPVFSEVLCRNYHLIIHTCMEPHVAP